MDSSAQWSARRALIVVGLGLAWIGLAAWLAPLIEDAYFDRGPGWLNGLIDASARPLEEYTRWWTNITRRFALAFGVAAVLAASPTGWRRQFTRERLLAPAGPRAIALARMTVAGVVLTVVLWEDVVSGAALNRELVRAHGVMKLYHQIPGFTEMLGDFGAMTAFKTVTALIVVAAGVGFKTRWTTIAGAVLYLAYAGIVRQWSWSFHTGLIPFYAMTVVAFCPAADIWSVDAWLARRRGRPTVERSADAYAWARLAITMAVVVPYFEAGMSKLCNGGILWWNADNLRYVLFMDALNPMEFDFGLTVELTRAPDWFFAFLGLSAVGGEVMMIGVLWSKFARRVFPGVMIAMHVGIVLLQHILFFDLIVLLGLLYAFQWFEGRDEAPTREVASRPVARWAPRAVGVMTAVLAACWLLTIEFFPLTAMQMYSHNRKNLEFVEYYQIVAHDSDGEVRRAYPEHVVPALRDSRYRAILRSCFDDELRPSCERFLQKIGAMMNDRGDGVLALEVQKRHWNHRAPSDDGRFGVAVERVRVDVAQARASVTRADR